MIYYTDKFHIHISELAYARLLSDKIPMKETYKEISKNGFSELVYDITGGEITDSITTKFIKSFKQGIEEFDIQNKDSLTPLELVESFIAHEIQRYL